MTILKADILIRVNNALNLEETDIDWAIEQVLDDIAKRDEFRKTTGTITTTESDYDYDLPSDLRLYEHLQVEEGNTLDRISFNEFLKRIPDCPIIIAKPENIYEKIKEWLEKREDLQKIGALGPAFVKKYHDPDKIIEMMIEKYNEAFSKKLGGT